MKLYNAMLSPFAGRCRMQLYAKGLEVEIAEAWDDFSQAQLAALNPMTKIPLLQEEGFALPESEIICEYLEDRYPEPPLRPRDHRARARMRLLSRTADFYVFEPLAPLFAHLSRKRRDQVVVDRQIAELARGLRATEHHLSPAGFAAGPTLTLADCALAPILLFVVTYLPFFDIADPLGPYPELAAYWTRVQRDPSAARVIGEIRHAIEARAGG